MGILTKMDRGVTRLLPLAALLACAAAHTFVVPRGQKTFEPRSFRRDKYKEEWQGVTHTITFGESAEIRDKVPELLKFCTDTGFKAKFHAIKKFPVGPEDTMFYRYVYGKKLLKYTELKQKKKGTDPIEYWAYKRTLSCADGVNTKIKKGKTVSFRHHDRWIFADDCDYNVHASNYTIQPEECVCKKYHSEMVSVAGDK